MRLPVALVALGLAAIVACQAASNPPAATAPPSGATSSAGPITSGSPVSAPPSREGTCAMRVSESLTPANDLSCPGDGLVVVADGITLDLGGHTPTGPGIGPQPWPLPPPHSGRAPAAAP